MKKHLFFLFFLFSTTSWGQTFQYDLVNVFRTGQNSVQNPSTGAVITSSSNIIVSSVDYDPNGNLLFGGETNRNFYIGSYNINYLTAPYLSSGNIIVDHGFYFGKKNIDGSFAWAGGIKNNLSSNSNNDFVVKSDNDGNLIVMGCFAGTIDLDWTSTGVYNITAEYTTNFFIAKYSATGQLIWGKAFGGDNAFIQNGNVANDGSVYIGGNFSGTFIDLIPGTEQSLYNHSNMEESYIIKLDGEGNYKWSKILNAAPTKSTKLRRIGIGSEDEIYLTGLYNNPTGIGGTSINSTNGSNDVFIIKYNKEGILQWSKNIGSTADETDFPIIAADTSGNFYLSFFPLGAIDVDPGPSNVTIPYVANSPLVLKYDRNANFLWQKQLISPTSGKVITQDIDCNAQKVFITGVHYLSFDADSDPTKTTTINYSGVSSWDIFCSVYDKEGNCLQGFPLSSTDNDWTASIAQYNGTKFMIGGQKYGFASLDFDPSTANTNDYFYQYEYHGFLAQYLLFDITKQPVDINNCNSITSDYNFSITTKGTIHSFNWQVDKNDGNGFTYLIDDSIYYGTTTSSLYLRFMKVNNSMNGYKYRCVLNQNTITTLNSTEALLTIFSEKIFTSAVNRTICQSSLPILWYNSICNEQGTYQYYFIQNSGCVVNTMNLSVNQNPLINTTASTASICMGDTLTLSATGANTYLWMPGSITGATIKVTPTQSTIYSVTGTSLSGCKTDNNITTTKWKKINAGKLHTLAIKSDGTLWAWGNNGYGQLGNGTTTNSLTPIQIGTANNWASISAGGGDFNIHTMAIKTDGTLWAWGSNFMGQFGNGTTTNSSIPIQIGTENNWSSISAGAYHTMAIKTDGTLWTWGFSGYGQLGNGTTTGSLTPVQIGTANNWSSISAGSEYSMAIKTDGTLWAWGYNGDGQLGNGTTINSSTPVQIGTANNWASISAGRYHTTAIKTDGTLWAWGLNNNGQIGDGTTTNSSTPLQIGSANNWASIDAGGIHTAAIKTDGTLWAWGSNGSSQLGDGTRVYSSTPVQIGTANNWVSISAGGNHTLSIKTDGKLCVWGNGYYGQLGNGNTNNIKTPTNLPSAIIINLPSTSSKDSSICATQFPILWNGITFNSVGSQTVHLINTNGCDSAATLNLSLKPNSYSTTVVSLCASQFPYLWNNITYNTPGTYQVSLTNAIGCDSIATLQLNLKPSSSSTTNVSICPSQLPYVWNGTSYPAGGSYSYITANAAGCDSTAILMLDVKSNSTSSTTITICPSQFPYTWNGKVCNTNGTYLVHLTNAAGCDSAATLILKSSLLICGYTIPTPQNLPYTQNFGTTTFNTPFAGMIGWVGSGSRPFSTQASAEASLEGADQTISATVPATGGAGGLYGHAVSSNGMLTILQSSNSTSGTPQVVLAVKTTGYNAITISYDLILTIANTRSLGLSLQYRVGNTGPFISIPSSAVTYNSTSTNLGTLDGPTNVDRYSFSLPIAALDKPEVELRWTTWRPSGSGSSSGISIDNISISGTIGCLSPIINNHPDTTKKSVCVGNNFEDSLSVIAYGTSLNYQWYKNATKSNIDGTLIPGASASSYSPVSSSVGVNYYYCVISNTCNTIKTNISGAFEVNGLPLINPDPDKTICNNDTVLISTLSSSPDYNYAWTPNENISNANTRNPLVYPIFNTDYILTQTSLASGCTAKDTVRVNVKQKSSSITDITTCSNQLPVIWNNNAYQNQGLYEQHFTNTNGCDSTAKLNLVINEASYDSTSVMICANQTPYLWNNRLLNNSGLYVYTTNNAIGCDSIVTLNLTVNPSDDIEHVVNVCRSELPYYWDGDNYTESGNYTKNYTNAFGCDSIVTLNLNVVENSYNTEEQTSCNSYSWHNNVYTSSGVYTYNYLNSNSCVSVDTLFLTINNSTNNNDYFTACENFIWHDSIYTSTGTYTFEYENQFGCVSVDTLHLIVHYGSNHSDTIAACEMYNWHGVDYNTSGIYTHEYTNENGCYSVDTLHLTINNGTNTAFNETACESYSWHGIDYLESGVYVFNYTNEFGCASIETLTLTIIHGSHSTDTITACESYIWHDNIYTSSGTYTYDYINDVGCPSTDTLKLNINRGTYSSAYLIACTAYNWHGTTYTSSGTYTFNYTNILNCTSVDTLHLTINSISNTSIAETACELYTWHGQSYSTSGIYTWVGENVMGCDSIVTLNLSINKVTDSTVFIQALNSYDWHGINYNQSGIYSYTTTNALGCDSMVMLNLSIYQCVTTYSTTWDSICMSTLPYYWNGITINDTGSYQKLLVNHLGCDSIATLNLAYYNFNPIISISNNSSNTVVCKANPEMISYNVTGCSNCKVHYNVNGIFYDALLNIYNSGQGNINIMPEEILNYPESEILVEITSAEDLRTGCVSDVYNTNSIPIQVIQSYQTNANWNFTTTSANQGNFLNTSQISQGNSYGTSQLLNTNAFSSGYVGASGGSNAGIAATTGAFNPNQSAYFEFAVSNDNDFNFVLNQISFGTRSTITGPKTYLIRSSLDNFTSNIDSGSIQNNSSWALKSKSGLRLNGLGNNNPVTFRIYGFNGIGSAAAGIVNWRIDDLKLDFTIVPLQTVVNTTTQQVCGNLISNPLDAVLPELSTGTWSQISGPGTTNFSNINDKNAIATASAYGNYVYKWTVESTCNGLISTGEIEVKYNQDSIVENQVACDSFTWHGITYFNSTSTPIFMVNNSTGCDTIIHLNLLINKPSTHIDSISICNYQLPYSWNGDTYTASGIYTKVVSNAVGCDSTITLHLSVTNCSVTLNIKAFLEGYYLGNNLMRSNLYELGMSNNPTETDSIEIDLWEYTHLNNSNPDFKVNTVLHNDGNASVHFPIGTLGGRYYIAIKHKNSIEIWSGNPISLSTNNFYNFSNDFNSAYSDGFSEPMKSMGYGVYALYSGDINQDGSIDIFDMQIVEMDASQLAYGYNNSDTNGDGSTDIMDMQLIENNANLLIFRARP